MIPTPTPTTSAIQSLKSALRLKLGWISSIRPPKALAPTNTGRNPKRPVLERGKDSAVKAMRCTNLSLPSGIGGGASKGQSIETVRMVVKVSVRVISRDFRIWQNYWSLIVKASMVFTCFTCCKIERCLSQGFGGSDKLKACLV